MIDGFFTFDSFQKHTYKQIGRKNAKTPRVYDNNFSILKQLYLERNMMYPVYPVYMLSISAISMIFFL